MIIQCCICRRVHRGPTWVEIENAGPIDEPVSHGYCPACAEAAFEEMRRLHAVDAPTSPERLAEASNQ